MVITQKPYDVAVIGGGPVGSQVAFRLAGMGHRVIVLEKKESLSNPVCCTGVVSCECVDAFSIPDSVIYRRVNGARLFSPSSELLVVRRNNPQAAILNRTAFNMLWAERAQIAGVEFLYGCDVRSVKPDKKSVSIDILHEHEFLSVRAKAVVVSTGFGSRLVDGLDLEGAGDFVMGVQAEVATRGVNEVEVYFGSKVAPSFFAWLVPTTPGKAIAGLLSRRYPPAYLHSFLTILAAAGKIVTDDVTFTYGGVPLRPLPKTYQDRVLVVGTAAGHVKPMTGGGIYFGLICADIAADTLNNRLSSNDFSAEKMAAYQRKWKQCLARELRVGYWARRVFEKLNDQQLDRLFKVAVSSGLIDELSQVETLSFDWHADVVARIFSHRLLLKAFRSIKLPIHLRKRIRKGF